MDVNAKNKDGDTALHLAIYASHEGAAKRLMEEPAVDINVKNNNVYTPLMVAQERGLTP
ncbi:ankyrin repeat domain-containing protein [Candidatus Cardinium sp. TP]|uniref:ankyrin repeat domain-containing protein n=1 Tax=Candidatus Cardinium sp. TP TaxID=2961955 RepID=UPI00263C7EB1|nr:ankyrin repeat domain-containing protein [Candidatus Cardinium sp.]